MSHSSHSHESQFLSRQKTNENVLIKHEKKKKTLRTHCVSLILLVVLLFLLVYSFFFFLFFLLLFCFVFVVAAVLNLRKMAQRNKLKCSKSRRWRCRASFHSATSYHTTQYKQRGEGVMGCGRGGLWQHVMAWLQR